MIFLSRSSWSCQVWNVRPPGRPTRAYLYYTNEHKHWVEPTTVTVVP